jgi:membrane protease YdiL (CAAX protease family)
VSYIPFPTGGGSNWVTDEPPRPPRSVITAVRFMYSGAILYVLSVIWTVAGIGKATSTILQSQPTDTASQVHSAAVQQIVFMAAGELFGAALWLWMARKNSAGRGWARVVASALFAIDTLVTLLIVIGGGLGGSLFTVAEWAVELIATIWLWREESSQYFADSRYWGSRGDTPW